MTELIVIATPEASGGRGLEGARALLNTYNLTLERILRRTGDGGQREFHHVFIPDDLAETLLVQLNSDPDVAGAYASPKVAPPPVSPGSYVSYQTYLNASPDGVGAVYAKGLPGGKGANVKFLDIEYGINLNHEEFAGQVTVVVGYPSFSSQANTDHGTAAVGITKARHNGIGIDGIAPDVTALFASAYNASGVSQIAPTIQTAADLLSAGDVMLLELQIAGPNWDGSVGFIPIEWYPDIYEAIKYATNKGIIVGEAAGNGYQNLDDPIYDTPLAGFPEWWVNPFRRTTLDSGAIIVGAGASPSSTEPTRSRRASSNYGACLDVQAQGDSITAPGYGTLWNGGGDPNAHYTGTYNATSGASAIVAGALCALSGVAKARGVILSPAAVRAALRATGVAQQASTSAPTSQRIGSTIDLSELIPYLALVDAPAPPPTPKPPTKLKKGWVLEVRDPLDRALLARYDSVTNPGYIGEGFVNHRYANGTCGVMSFSARPDRMTLPPRSIIHFYADTGRRVVKLHWGVLTTTPDARSGAEEKYESLPGKHLLEKSRCNSKAYISYPNPVDAALYMRKLVELYRHPALKYDPERIPVTGIPIGPVDARGTRLDKALEAIIQAVPSLGEDDWGVDAEGYVVIRPPTGKITLDYADVSAQWKGGATRSEDTVTRAHIRVSNALSSGVIPSNGYQPDLLGFFYQHPAHPVYQAEGVFDMPKRENGEPILEVLRRHAATELNPNGWTNPQNLSDNDEATFATSNADAEIFAYQGSSTFETIAGAEAIIDAAAGSYNLFLGVAFYLQGQTSSFAYAYLPLSEIKGQGKVLVRISVPPAVVPSGQTATHGAAYLKIGGSANGLVKLHELRLLELNTPILSQIAQSNIRLPAVEVQEVTCARGIGTGGEAFGGFLLTELGKELEIPDVPDVNGKTRVLRGEIKEITDNIMTNEGIISRISLGDKIRDSDVRAVQDAIRRATEGG